MIHARIQAHPSRAHLHDRLIAALGMEAEILLHESDPPNPWEGYKRCLERIPPFASHLLIAQDDCIPAPGFADAIQVIAARHPDSPVCLFMGSLPASTAIRIRRAKPDVRYVPLVAAKFVPLVCVLWPTHVARGFLEWSRTAPGMTRADDGNAARWVRGTRQQVYVTVPSIVQHDDAQKSVKGGRDHTPWAESWRKALLLADDATSYEW